ncbi:uncharacterized protein LOC130054563 isoform X2 [Ostrea edulis]|uniref:uncharacterized protein LOC130054563 isoform X2 n=1 Tax=Ostrea edulis TaxID=37623 RepID=UPI0024AF32F9|nr:uncharacterized protein LOC130054563 isoform X2 [Ostrea edulis]
MWKLLLLLVVFLVIQDSDGLSGLKRKHVKLYRTTICEHNRKRVRCGRGEKITVHYAMYGRRSKNTCSKYLKGRFSTRCKAKHSKHITKRHCNGKRFCTLHASNSVFGDPCRGTYKYLAVTYSCRKRIQRVRVHVIKKALRRRRNVIKMKCGRHRVIAVRSAKYIQPLRYTRRRGIRRHRFRVRRRRNRRRWRSARRGRSSRRRGRFSRRRGRFSRRRGRSSRRRGRFRRRRGRFSRRRGRSSRRRGRSSRIRGIHKNVTRKVKSLCNGKRRCTLWSNKPKRGKGYKYIRVKYSCKNAREGM